MERFYIHFFIVAMAVLLLLVFFITYNYMRKNMGPDAPSAPKVVRKPVKRKIINPEKSADNTEKTDTESTVEKTPDVSIKENLPDIPEIPNEKTAEIKADTDSAVIETEADTSKDDFSSLPEEMSLDKTAETETDDLTSEISDFMNNITCLTEEGDDDSEHRQ